MNPGHGTALSGAVSFPFSPPPLFILAHAIFLSDFDSAGGTAAALPDQVIPWGAVERSAVRLGA